MDEKLKCKICGKEYEKYLNIIKHVREEHNLLSKEYYDLYFRKYNEELCSFKSCDNKTRYLNFRSGYTKHCSTRCSTLNPKTQDKMKETTMENYGVEHALQSKEIFKKMQDNNFKKYGKKNISQIEEIKNKAVETCIKKYGGPAPMCDPKIKKRVKDKKEAINDKRKKTSIRKYGVEYPMVLKEIQDKARKTCIEKYGVDYITQTDKNREAQRQRMLKGQAAYCNKFIKNPSKPQVELYNLVKQLYSQTEINYQYLNYSIDIAIPELMIAIEYDGYYWHKDKEYDKNRQTKLEDGGWRVLRYLDIIPSIEQLKIDIEGKI